MTKAVKVLFICMGNICRSPTAEAVFKRLVEQAGLQDRILSDSAGTHDYHLGDAPDARAQEAASKRGYDMSGLRARQVTKADFENFDYLLAMDEHNLAMLKSWSPRPHLAKVQLFTAYSSRGECVVPDPYYGGPRGFEHVLDLIEESARGLLEHIRRRLDEPKAQSSGGG